MQVLLHVLFEHAAGYALFAVREVEEISLLLPQVRAAGRARRGERVCAARGGSFPGAAVWGSPRPAGA